ncbi:hypothetical protein EVAR_31320_1 [Eumeta japonica]|uniref:RNA-directed DNA polymerase from mobile element jockey n=1 Tax=Eumeta variegata TaxID=151549 RepID=A0A4C1XYN0_EUMVA|nr:hypothetical protein EVAR_31320_1 [Eumeta japonica]
MPNQLRLRGQAMEWKTCVRYLGVHIDLSPRIVPEVDYVIQMSRAVRAKLCSIFTFRLPIRTKIAIYKCCISFRLTHAAPTWYALCSELQRQCLQIQQNLLLCMIAGAGWFVKSEVIARDLKVETLEDFINMLARRTFNLADAALLYLTTWHHNAMQATAVKAISSKETCCPFLPMRTRCKA